MRAVVDMVALGQRTLWVDCDVLQADGGTRTAAITGSYVALGLAIQKLIKEGRLTASPILTPVAAVSVGIVQKQVLLDLCYVEDSAADVDMNLVMTGAGDFIEVQGTGEKSTFSQVQLDALLNAGRSGLSRLLQLQKEALA